MSDIQEQLRKIEYVPPDAKDAPLGLYDKKELEALIQEQIRLARIKEQSIALQYMHGWEYKDDYIRKIRKAEAK